MSSDSNAEVTRLLDAWKHAGEREVELLPILDSICEVFEKETEAYYKMDPDPMDDRHPGRASPQCVLGQIMKTLFRNEELMTKVVGQYMMSGRVTEESALHTGACRLLLVVMPGLETSVVFQETEGLVERLLNWARSGSEPLRSYATGLLAGAMDIQDVAHAHKDANVGLVPIMLQRLHELKAAQEEQDQLQSKNGRISDTGTSVRHFASIGHAEGSSQSEALNNGPCTAPLAMTENSSAGLAVVPLGEEVPTVEALGPFLSQMTPPLTVPWKSPHNAAPGMSPGRGVGLSPGMSPARSLDEGSYRNSLKRALSPAHSLDNGASKRPRTRNDSYGGVFDPDTSNSSWAEMEPFVIGSYSLKSPLTVGMKARLILQYLSTMGDYQELLRSVLEGQALELIFFYMDLTKNKDVRLAFEALKYLATLLCHKKFTIEFLQRDGVQHLLRIQRPSIAATGVALCFYYLSYFEDAMERVCLLPDHILSDLVGYMLWLMECSHESSRCHACMFFSQVFPFRVMLDLFDQRDGLRRLLNTISTLEILNVEQDHSGLSDDQLFAMRQQARHVCGALKKYFEAHLLIKAEEVRHSHIRSDGTSPVQETLAYKPMKLLPQVITDSVELLMELLPVRSQWLPESTFHKLGGPTLLMQLIAMAPAWTNFPGKPETIRSALDVLYVLTVMPKSQMLMLTSIKMENDVTTPVMSVLVGLAEAEVLPDAEVQRGALNVLINCVCGPVERLGGGVGRYMGSGSKRKSGSRLAEDLLSRLWGRVQTNNGIMVLLKLLTVKMPITEADSIRALACRALVGLSRSEAVKQILGKLPLFNNGQLQNLMKEPVLQDKRQEHIKFCKYGSQLLDQVSGKQANKFDASLEDIRRADIVAQTKICYREKELLQLIHDHLLCKGLTEAASALQQEAGLPRCSTPPPPHPACPHIFSPATPKLQRQVSQPMPGHSVATPAYGSLSVAHTLADTPSHLDHSMALSVTTPSLGPLRFTLHRNSLHSPGQPRSGSARLRFSREGHSSNRMRLAVTSRGGPGEYNMSLDKIVTEYLRKQHELCRKPVATCPPMSLFEPHRCPQPLGRHAAPHSITSRLINRAVQPPYGGSEGAKLDRKLLYSRFTPYQTFRDKDDTDTFASCCFSYDEYFLMVGTFSGDLKLIDINQWEETTTLQCHQSPIIRIEPGHKGKLLLTSSWGVQQTQESALWKYDDVLEIRYKFDDHIVEFSKLTQDRIIGTNNEQAHIYDVATGTLLATLYDSEKANNYKANQATFSPTDDLVLNDGILWDVRIQQPLHKFDKFNQYISGVFNPKGLEIIINSEVWDVRTYKLLHTVPTLDQCQIKFNHKGDVIFATHVDDSEWQSQEFNKGPYSSTLRTFDATDYSSICTMDLKTRSIFDLCMDSKDSMMAVVEQNNSSQDQMGEESIVRLYQMLKLRDEEDIEQEEEEEAVDEGDGDDDDDDDDDDEDPSFLEFGSSDNEDGNDNDAANNGQERNSDRNNGQAEEDDDDDEPFVMEYSPSNSEDDDDDDDNEDNENDDLDDVLFALV